MVRRCGVQGMCMYIEGEVMKGCACIQEGVHIYIGGVGEDYI